MRKNIIRTTLAMALLATIPSAGHADTRVNLTTTPCCEIINGTSFKRLVFYKISPYKGRYKLLYGDDPYGTRLTLEKAVTHDILILDALYFKQNAVRVK